MYSAFWHNTMKTSSATELRCLGGTANPNSVIVRQKVQNLCVDEQSQVS